MELLRFNNGIFFSFLLILKINLNAKSEEIALKAKIRGYARTRNMAYLSPVLKPLLCAIVQYDLRLLN